MNPHIARPAGPGLPAGAALAKLDADIAATMAHLEALQAKRSWAQSARASAPPPPTVDLYRWQSAALESWQAADRRGVVQAVTGAGKTRVGVAAVAEALAAGRRAVVMVPSLVLARQWVATITELLPGVDVVDAIRAGRGWQVLVTTVQSASRRSPLAPGETALLVADECHRYGAEQFSLALRPGFDWRLGLSATLHRGDDGDEILAAYFGGVVHDLGYGQALADDLIAPFTFAQVGVPLTPAERAEYDTLTQELRETRGYLVLNHGIVADPVQKFLAAVSNLADGPTGNRGVRLARRYMARFSRRKALLAETTVKRVALASLTPAIEASSGTIVFTQTQSSSTQAAEVLQQQGCTAAAVHGELDKEDREERIDLFRDGSVRALAAPRILDEGVDVPEADLGITLASNRSKRQMIQRLGRVLRKRPDKVARFVVLYATDTVEDPFARDQVPDFYGECLPHARATARFNLADESDHERLLAFLGVGTTEAAATIASEFRTPDVAVAPPAPADVTTPKVRRQQNAPAIAAQEGDAEPLPQLGDAALTDDPVKQYLQEIARFPLLTAEQEVELAKAIEAGLYAEHLLAADDARFPRARLQAIARDGAEAREQFVCANLRLVVSLAKRYPPTCGLELLDRIQEGNLGLIRALQKFDYRIGNKFSTYATWWIKQSITRAIADQGSTIRVPVHFHEAMATINRFRRTADLTWSELLIRHPQGIEALNVSRDDLKRAAALSQPIISSQALQEQLDDSVVMHDILGDGPTTADEIIEALHLRERYETVMAVLDHEDPKGAFVLRARHGLLTGQPETLDVIGQRLGVTRERIRQIEKRTLELAEERFIGPRPAPPRRAQRTVQGTPAPRTPARKPRRAAR
ncbi:sigma-70 family RNA polymerase sigma factor [Propionibacteriaceae bacterium G57]|uniref:sigma-70 family RNA polymerase sigma factor n=1 Tax=Aestuariimicrobium sp. G57 TaxID=3418485 RepID=UPI003DA6E825